MNRRTTTIVTICLIAILSSLKAVALPIQTSLDKKTIYCDSLNLPPTTSIRDLLLMLPEILQRPGDMTYSNYDIMIEGTSTDQASDIALQDLDMSDIEKVEISVSTVTSYKSNGDSGSINLILRKKGEKGNEKTWGSAGLNFSNPWGIGPQLLIGTRQGKLLVRGVLLGDIYNGNYETVNVLERYNETACLNYVKDTRFRSQLANVYMQYELSPKDNLFLNLSETLLRTSYTTKEEYNTRTADREKKTDTSLNGLLKYTRSIGKSTLTLQAVYEHNPQGDYSYTYGSSEIDKRNYVNYFSGKTEYAGTIKWRKTQMDYSAGAMANTSSTNHRTTFHSLESANTRTYQRHDESSTLFLQPYASITAKIGQMVIKMSAEYQHYEQEMERRANKYRTISNDVTSTMIAEWHFHPNHFIQATADRKLARPEMEQMFPFLHYSLQRKNYVVGNANLKPTQYNKISLTYLSSYKWGKHSLQCDIDADYFSVKGIVSQVEKQITDDKDAQGSTMSVTSFENSAYANLYDLNLMALYSYKAFALSLTANMSFLDRIENGLHNHYNLWNISLNPHFNMKDGWNGSMCLTYNSKVILEDGEKGDFASLRLSFGKRWGQFNVRCSSSMPLIKKTHNIAVLSPNEKVHEYTEISPALVEMGVKYHF